MLGSQILTHIMATGEQDPILVGCIIGHFKLRDALQYLLLGCCKMGGAETDTMLWMQILEIQCYL